MLLERIELHNIRSYTQQSVSLTPGTTLLCGDIGCGKTSLLLAIEFALFGSSRPDLPADLLLRKGEQTGHVLLDFSLGEKKVKIKRSLKRGSQGILQQPGFIEINGVRETCSPVELKAKVIELLGYPQEQVSKNKNLLYRFSVYTPQEDMKLILHESSEARLEVLRKLFGIDKYKLVRENVELYLRSLRREARDIKIRLEPKQETLSQKEDFVRIIGQEEEKFTQLETSLSTLRSRLEQLETQEKALLVKLRELEVHQARMQDLTLTQKKAQENLVVLEEKKSELHSNLIRLTQVRSLQEVEIQLDEKRSRLLKLRERQSHLKSESHHLTEKKLRETKEIEALEKQLQEKQTLEKQLLHLQEQEGLEEEIGKRLSKARTQRETSERELHIARRQLEDEKTKLVRVGELSHCPTCLQEVAEQHKQHLHTHFIEKEKELEPRLRLLDEQVRSNNLQEKQLEAQLVQAREASLRLHKLKERLIGFKESEERLQHSKKEFEHTRMQLARITQEFGALEKENLNLLASEITALEKEMKDSQQVEQIKTSYKQVCVSLSDQKMQLEEMSQELSRLQGLLTTYQSVKKNSTSLSSQLREVREQVTQTLRLHTQSKTTLEHKRVQLKQVEEKLQSFASFEQKLGELRLEEDWLSRQFIPLSITIEKHVMTSIHTHFSALFREWFSLLIEDDYLDATLDDSFSPVLEQNGYETSFIHLSGGEKTAAALAYRLALNRVINDATHTITTKDLLILDEPTEGFSSQQLDSMREVLDRLELGQIILVSHEAKLASYAERLIEVRKIGHVSSIGS